MSEDVKTKIHQMIDTITDESLLQLVAEDVQYYANDVDIADELDAKQTRELDDAISEADNNDVITWIDFKKEMNGKGDSSIQTFQEK